MARHLNSSEASFSSWIFVLYSALPGHQVPGCLSRVRPIKRVSKEVLGLNYRKLVRCEASLASMLIFFYEIVGANRNVWECRLDYFLIS